LYWIHSKSSLVVICFWGKGIVTQTEDIFLGDRIHPTATDSKKLFLYPLAPCAARNGTLWATRASARAPSRHASACSAKQLRGGLDCRARFFVEAARIQDLETFAKWGPRL